LFLGEQIPLKALGGLILVFAGSIIVQIKKT
jgi:drug/metabolite transporter (DMT)-like permease